MSQNHPPLTTREASSARGPQVDEHEKDAAKLSTGPGTIAQSQKECSQFVTEVFSVTGCEARAN